MTASFGLDKRAMSCVHLNRVLLALAQHAQYCHFTMMDPTRAVHWCVCVHARIVRLGAPNRPCALSPPPPLMHAATTTAVMPTPS